MARFGQFPENGQRQMAYIIYLIEVRGNTYKKASASKRIFTIIKTYFLNYVCIYTKSRIGQDTGQFRSAPTSTGVGFLPYSEKISVYFL